MDVWNLLDMTHLIFIPVLSICNMTREPLISIEAQVYMGALVSFSLIFKSYDWMRIFDSTSFYILLIFATIEDIGAFLVLFIVALFMFAMPLLILNTINGQLEDAPLIGDLTGWGPADAFLKQYEEVLAGFGPAAFPD